MRRVRAKNPGLNAIVYDFSEHALAAASRADAAAAAGGALGPLHGVPIAIQGNVDVVGHPTPNGVPAFEPVIAPDDSPLVRLLKNASPILVGRTNVSEFSLRVTTGNPLHGRNLNP